MTTTEQAEQRQALDDRLRALHDVDLGHVLEIIDYLRDEGDSVLVGGSIAYGLGNAKSDLDLVVCGPGTAESSSRMPLEHFLGTLRVDAWKLQRREIDELFERADEALADEAPFAGAFGDVFEQADLKLLHRLAFGVIIDGPILEGTGSRRYREIAKDILLREYAERMRSSAFIAQMAAAAGHDGAAAINARFAVEEALQARIAALGLPFSDNKWLQVRLDADLPELRASYAPFAVLPDPGEATGAYVAEAIAACERLTGLDLAAGTLDRDAQWRNTDVRLAAAGDLRALLSVAQGAVWELGPEEVDAWERLGGADTWSCGECDALQTALCFGLYSGGVLELAWTRGLPVQELAVEAVAAR